MFDIANIFITTCPNSPSYSHAHIVQSSIGHGRTVVDTECNTFGFLNTNAHAAPDGNGINYGRTICLLCAWDLRRRLQDTRRRAGHAVGTDGCVVAAQRNYALFAPAGRSRPPCRHTVLYFFLDADYLFLEHIFFLS